MFFSNFINYVIFSKVFISFERLPSLIKERLKNGKNLFKKSDFCVSWKSRDPEPYIDKGAGSGSVYEIYGSTSPDLVSKYQEC